MNVDMETIKLLINVATFSMTKKIEAMENNFQTKLGEQESNHKMEIERLETQNKTLFKMVEQLTETNARNEMSRQDTCRDILATKVYQQDSIINDIIKTQQNVIEKTIYYDNAIDRLGNQRINNINTYTEWNKTTGFNCKINSKAIKFYDFITEYGNPHSYCEYKNIHSAPMYNKNNDLFGRQNSIIYYVDPILLRSLNVFYNLKTLMYSPKHTCHGKLYINGFTDTDTNITPREHIFHYKLTPLFTVETLYIPLSSFNFWNSNLHKETYTNFFKNTFPNLKTIYISVCNYTTLQEFPGSMIKYKNYTKDAFMQSSIEYGLNYMIEHTNIEKIVFTFYAENPFHYEIPLPQLPDDICDYLKNIVSKNTTRQIILEIKNTITVEEIKNNIDNLI